MNHHRINPLEVDPSCMGYMRTAYSADDMLLVPQRTVRTLHTEGLRTLWRPRPSPTARTQESRPPVPPLRLPRVRAYPTLPVDIHQEEQGAAIDVEEQGAAIDVEELAAVAHV